MANRAQDLGQKFTCFKCECKFYDLGSPEPLCPRCGADQREDLSAAPPAGAKRTRGRTPRKTNKVQPASKSTTTDLGEGDLLDQSFAETPAEPSQAGDKGDSPDPSLDGPPAEALVEESAAKPAKAAKKPAAKKAPAKKAAAKKPAAKKAPAKKAAAKKPAAKKAAAKK